MKRYFALLLVFSMLFLVACQQETVVEEAPEEPVKDDFVEEPVINMNDCDEPRPEVCTMDYSPVCGNDELTYSNGCTACSNNRVDWYVEGEC